MPASDEYEFLFDKNDPANFRCETDVIAEVEVEEENEEEEERQREEFWRGSIIDEHVNDPTESREPFEIAPEPAPRRGVVLGRNTSRDSAAMYQGIQNMSRRMGRFIISGAFFNDHDIINMIAVFRWLGVVVIRCEHRADRNHFEYVGISPKFEVVPEGWEPPMYDLILRGNDFSTQRVPTPEPRDETRTIEIDEEELEFESPRSQR